MTEIKESTKSLLSATEQAVSIIAMARAAATVVDEMPEAEFDQILNEQCEKAHKKYQGKGKREIVNMMMAFIAQKNPGLLLDLLLRGGDE